MDTTFGTGGIVTTSIGEWDGAYSIAIQTDGKIVVTGTTLNGSDFDIVLIRYNTNGSLDGTFGTGGIVTTSIGSGDDVVYSIALQNDGKILVCGVTETESDYDIALLRYDTNGALDGTFGLGGIVITSINGEDFAQSIALQSDGKIVLCGVSENSISNAFY